ncbi:MAG TPA: tetratricopeptide repeat protein [Dongiaceae bacterium]
MDAYSKRDFKTALNEWLPLAEAGDPTAQNAVGALYNHGLGVDRDDAAAVHWYQMAADQNFPLAMRNLASMYATGHGVPFDKDQADLWYQKAAEAGDPVAIKRMAAKSPTGTEFTAAPAAEPGPVAEPMTVAGGDQPTEQTPASPPPAQTAAPQATAQPAAEPAPAATATADGGEAPQYGDDGTSAMATSAGTGTAPAAPAKTQQAAITQPPVQPQSDPDNWLIGMWQGPSLGCPPGGGLEFVQGETRSYYQGQIAARLPAKYAVQGDHVTVTSTGVDGIGHTYEYERKGPDTFVITAVPAEMPQSMIGIEHHRCAGLPLKVAAAPAAAPAPAPAPAPAEAPKAKPFVVAEDPAPAAAPAPKAAPVKPVAEAPKLEPMPGAQQAAASPQPATPGTAQAGWDAFGRGDYKGALAVWQPLAEKGDVSMQLLVGSIYDYGQGVPQDDAEAAKWYERAANEGSAKGQYQLGAIYARSPQVKNPVEGYKWLTIAAHTLNGGSQEGITADQATTLRTLLEPELTPDQIAQAKKEAAAFKATKG